MKRTVAALTTSLALAVTACGSNAQNAREYEDVNALVQKIRNKGITWECEQREYSLVGDSVADCRDAKGDSIFIAVYHDSEEQSEHLRQMRENADWQSQVPEMILGENWHVHCHVPNQCGEVAEKVGGYLVAAPDYASAEAASEVHEILGIN